MYTMYCQCTFFFLFIFNDLYLMYVNELAMFGLYFVYHPQVEIHQKNFFKCQISFNDLVYGVLMVSFTYSEWRLFVNYKSILLLVQVFCEIRILYTHCTLLSSECCFDRVLYRTVKTCHLFVTNSSYARVQVEIHYSITLDSQLRRKFDLVD